MTYRSRYFTAFSLLLISLFCLLTLYRALSNNTAELGYPKWGIAILSAVLWCYIAHAKGLILLKSAPLDYALYYIVLVASITLLWTFTIDDLFGLNAMGNRWQTALSSYQQELSGQAEQELKSINIWTLLEGGQNHLMKVITFIWALTGSLYGVILRSLLLLLSGILLIAVILSLGLAYLIDLKSGILWILLAGAFSAIVFTLNKSEYDANYIGIYGVTALIGSLAFSINWGNLQANGDLSKFHPNVYGILTTILRTNKTVISKSHLREEISNTIGDIPTEQRKIIIDAVEQRLAAERVFRPTADGRLELGYKKRVGLRHIFVALLTLVYLFNPGFGIVEIIPDNLPVVGNLDEGVLIALVSNWIFMAWRKDRHERLGESVGNTPGITLPSDFGSRQLHPTVSPHVPSLDQLAAPATMLTDSTSSTSVTSKQNTETHN